MIRTLPILECAPASNDELMPAAEAERLAAVLKVLADPVRLRLLRLVADSPDTTACACHLPDALGISQPTLSHHMKILYASGMGTPRKEGKWTHYSISEAGCQATITLFPSLTRVVDEKPSPRGCFEQ